MPEQYTLTAAITKPNQTLWKIDRLTIDIANAIIQITLRGDNNEIIQKTYDASTTPTGTTVLHALNTGNFTTTSLAKTIFNRLSTDGVVTAGTTTGTPV